MLNKTEFTQMPDVATIERRNEVCDIWVRQNIEQIEKEDGIVFVCDEAYMNMDAEDCPDVEEIKVNAEEWFELAKEWKEPKQMSSSEMQAKIEYLEILVKGV